MRIKFPLLIIACCLLLMACGHKNTQKNYQAYYSFNNVTTSTQEKQLAKALKSKGIPTKDWDNLAPYISRYNQENTNLQPVVKKWTQSKIGNVTTSTQEKQLAKALKSKGIPTKDWDNLAPYISRYNQENTNLQPVVKKWTQSKIGKDQNQFVTFLNEKTFEDNKSHFTDDLNCRRTSFLLLHDLITSSEDLTKLDLPLQNEFIDLKSRHKDLTAKDQALYSLLFGDNISYQSTDDLLKAWKKAGLKFPEKVKLLSVFQNSPGDVSNFHTAIAYEKNSSIYVFEKQDPTLPYRWNRFNNWADIKTHWLSNRFKVFKDNVDILVNDQKFDDFLENTLYIPQNNQLAPQDE